MSRNLYKYFRKRYTNEYPSTKVRNGKQVPMMYRRDDLSKWAEEAFTNGKYYFYAKPVNPEKPYGEFELCEPEFEYVLAHPLSQEELNELFDEECYVDLKEYMTQVLESKKS